MNYDNILTGVSTKRKADTLTTLQGVKDYKYIYTFKELTEVFTQIRQENPKYDSTPQFLAYLAHLEN